MITIICREKVIIPKSLPFVTFFGDAENPPTITGNDTASATGKDGKPLRTFQSATVAVEANYFVAVNVKFEVNTHTKYVNYIYNSSLHYYKLDLYVN